MQKIPKVLVVHFGNHFSQINMEQYKWGIATLTELLEEMGVSVERFERLPNNHEIATCDGIIFISFSFKKEAKKIKSQTDKLVFVITGLPEEGDDAFGVITLEKSLGYHENAETIHGKLTEKGSDHPTSKMDIYCQICGDNIFNTTTGFGTSLGLYYYCSRVLKKLEQMKNVWPSTELDEWLQQYNNEAKYQKETGLVPHKTHPKNGKMARDCYFCRDCAGNLIYRCDQCGSELSKNEFSPL